MYYLFNLLFAIAKRYSQKGKLEKASLVSTKLILKYVLIVCPTIQLNIHNGPQSVSVTNEYTEKTSLINPYITITSSLLQDSDYLVSAYRINHSSFLIYLRRDTNFFRIHR